ncbi:Succinate dehydrogenase assembly factor 4 mitochondrial [Euphorbia peplus]|nr:Succinate dehydrogenase assembly factor 4 mitochondrial [Euphorbia peplus]
MARNNLSRVFASSVFSSISSTPAYTVGSEPVARSVCSSLSRLMSSSSIPPLVTLSKKEGEEKDPIKQNPEIKNGQDKEEEEDDDDDGDVNKDTGEIGGPRGPEPTRYGDWERNGRCSDF